MAYRYNIAAVREVLDFLEELELTEDEFDGLPFRVEPWMEEVITQIFGRVDDAGEPLVHVAYLEVPKKSAKSTLCAALVLVALVLLRQGSGYQVYGAASTQKQAGKSVFRLAREMAKRNPELRDLLTIRSSTYRIYRNDDPTCIYEAIAADGDTQDGFNPAFVIVDELHRWRTRKAQELWDILTTSGIARKRTLVIAITTAGTEDESPIAWAMHEKTLDIERKIYSDPHFYGRIWGASPTDDWQAEDTWTRCHPGLECNGGHLKIQKLREALIEAQHDSAARVKFKRYYLNIWGEREESVVQLAEWNACGEQWHAEPCSVAAVDGVLEHPSHDSLKRFFRRPCVVGIDLSLTTDLSAVTALFPVDEAALDEGVEALFFPFAPEEGFRHLTKRTGKPYKQWATDGWLRGCPGDKVLTAEVVERLKWCREMFDVREFAFDKNCAGEVMSVLDKLGWQNLVEVQQSYAGMSEGVKRVLSWIQMGRFYHGEHPVARWNALSVTTIGDKKDNMMFAKPNRLRNSKRIDLMQAAAIAAARLVHAKPPLKPSKRGFAFV